MIGNWPATIPTQGSVTLPMPYDAGLSRSGHLIQDVARDQGLGRLPSWRANHNLKRPRQSVAKVPRRTETGDAAG